MSNLDYDVELNDGVITFKNVNTTLRLSHYIEQNQV